MFRALFLTAQGPARYDQGTQNRASVFGCAWRMDDCRSADHRRGEPFSQSRQLEERRQVGADQAAERLRWRAAGGALTLDAGRMLGGDRMRIEEPIRELVLDLGDGILQREVVLDARLHRVDLDRGEILPRWSFGDLRRLSFLARTDLDLLARYV